MTTTLAEAPAATPTSSAPGQTIVSPGDRWPRTNDAIPAWSATYDERLRPYLEWFGLVIVACTGDPDRLEQEARLWDGAERTLRATRVRLADDLLTVATWQGEAAATFRTAYDDLLRRLDAEAERLPRVAAALRVARDALRQGRPDAIRVTQAFVVDVARRTASISAPSPAVAAQLLTATVQDTFVIHQHDAMQVLSVLRSTMAQVARDLKAATPDEDALTRWFHSDFTRRGLNIVVDGQFPIGWHETALGVTGGLLNIPAEVARQTGRMQSPLAWALTTAPAGILRNIAAYADLPVLDNLLYQVPLTVGINYGAVYGSNWLMAKAGETSVMKKLLGEGASVVHDTPGKLLVNNSITSLLLTAKPSIMSSFPGLTPELVDESGSPRALTNGPAIAGSVYDVAAIGVPAAAIFGADTYVGLRGTGATVGAALRGGVTTGVTEIGVAGIAVGVASGITRPPEPNSLGQRGYDWWQRNVMTNPAVIATGAGISALSNEASYLSASAQELALGPAPKLGGVTVQPGFLGDRLVVVTQDMVDAHAHRVAELQEIRRRSADEISQAGRTMVDVWSTPR